MRGEGVQPSRTIEDLRASDAAAFTNAARVSLEDAAILTASWSRRRLIDVTLTLAQGTEGCTNCGTLWTAEDLKQAHSAWARGVRTPWTVDGERTYQRLRKRRLRSAS